MKRFKKRILSMLLLSVLTMSATVFAEDFQEKISEGAVDSTQNTWGDLDEFGEGKRLLRKGHTTMTTEDGETVLLISYDFANGDGCVQQYVDGVRVGESYLHYNEGRMISYWKKEDGTIGRRTKQFPKPTVGMYDDSNDIVVDDSE